MGFTSTLYPNERIINDTEGLDMCRITEGRSTGLELPYCNPADRRYEGVADDFPDELLIPESEWQARIQEMEETKTRLSDLAEHYQLPCKDQDGIPYCWIFAPVHALEVVRLQQNQEVVDLSPASAGAPIKNFRAVGGWGKEGLQWLSDKGCCPSAKWPAIAIDRRYYTEENKQLALNYRVHEWFELRPRNHKQMVSLLLRRFPCAVGLNWWGHEVTYYEPVWLDGMACIRQRNSWGMGWGTKGYAVLQGSRMYADDAVAPRSAWAA